MMLFKNTKWEVKARNFFSFLVPPILIVIVVLSSLVIFDCSALAQAESYSFDFSAKGAGEIFKLSESVWTSINQFVFRIGFDDYRPEGKNDRYTNEYTERFKELTSYSEMRTVAQLWKLDTFPALQKLASQLSDTEIKQLLITMKSSFDRIEEDPVGGYQDLNKSLNSLNQKISDLSQISASISQQFIRFDKATTALTLEYKNRRFPVKTWLSVDGSLNTVNQALGQINGRWHALSADLQAFQKVIKERSVNGLLDDLDVEVGINTWDDITKKAKYFIASLPFQERNLSGDFYYDYCQIYDGNSPKGNTLYALKSYLGSVLRRDEDGVMLEPVPNKFQDQQLWKLEKVGQGWWRIVNDDKRGYGQNTLVVNRDNEGRDAYNLVMDSTTTFSGRWWRCLPAEKRGWFRLINAFLGDELTLWGDRRGGLYMYKGDTINSEQQSWQLLER